MGLPGPPTAGQLSAVRVVEHTWHSTLVTWLSGRATIDQVVLDVSTVCRLIGGSTAPHGSDGSRGSGSDG